MVKLRIRAPAKINLFLEITGKRPDGYHEIETVMQAVSLYDRIEIKETSKDEIEIFSNHPVLCRDKTNLVFQAAALIKKRYAIKQGARFFIDKRIPIGAGLGGGSSDAAATILGLDKLWSLKLSPTELMVLAARLGSDVPFFINGGTSLCQGRGEIIFPLPFRKQCHYLIISPGIFIPSGKIYHNLKKEDLTKAGQSINIYIKSLLTGKMDQVGARLFNRLAPVIFRLYPQVEIIYDLLRKRLAWRCCYIWEWFKYVLFM